MTHRCLGWVAALVGALAVIVQPAQALFHLAVIDEVLSSYGGDPSAQFVEIRMLSTTQNFVSHSILGVFDGKGTFLGGFEVPSDVANQGTGVRWLIATSSFATASGVTPDFIIPPLLQVGGGMVCWGAPGVLPPDPASTWDHTDPTQYVDCVAYGLYSGATNSKVGTPTTLTADHHSLQRTGSTNNNSADFACGTSITPQNNAGATATLPATAACSSAPGVVYDEVLVARPALNVTIPAGTTSVTKKLKVAVRNISSTSLTFTVLATSDCPPGVTIDGFDMSGTSGIQPTAVVLPNKTVSATAAVTVTDAAFTNFSHRAPSRCTIRLFALEAAIGQINAFDEAWSNNVLPIELNVVDKNDPDQTGSPETFVKSVAPKKITIADAKTSKTIKPSAVAGNGDSAETLGHTVTVAAVDGICPFGTVGAVDIDGSMPGDQSSITIKGGKTKGAKVPLSATTSFRTTSAKTPARCYAFVSASGPSEPETAPRDPSNGTSVIVIDIVDNNDF